MQASGDELINTRYRGKGDVCEMARHSITGTWWLWLSSQPQPATRLWTIGTQTIGMLCRIKRPVVSMKLFKSSYLVGTAPESHAGVASEGKAPRVFNCDPALISMGF